MTASLSAAGDGTLILLPSRRYFPAASARFPTWLCQSSKTRGFDLGKLAFPVTVVPYRRLQTLKGDCLLSLISRRKGPGLDRERVWGFLRSFSATLEGLPI